jgi:hypothetical protein
VTSSTEAHRSAESGLLPASIGMNRYFYHRAALCGIPWRIHQSNVYCAMITSHPAEGTQLIKSYWSRDTKALWILKVTAWCARCKGYPFSGATRYTCIFKPEHTFRVLCWSDNGSIAWGFGMGDVQTTNK